MEGTHGTPVGRRPLSIDATRSWLALLAWLAFGWWVVFVLAPWAQQWEPVGKLHAYIRDTEIEATALYYTDIQEFSDAEASIRNRMAYGNHRQPPDR